MHETLYLRQTPQRNLANQSNPEFSAAVSNTSGLDIEVKSSGHPTKVRSAWLSTCRMARCEATAEALFTSWTTRFSTPLPDA